MQLCNIGTQAGDLVVTHNPEAATSKAPIPHKFIKLGQTCQDPKSGCEKTERTEFNSDVQMYGYESKPWDARYRTLK